MMRLLALFLLISAPSFAATTISTTLTLTSPTALISMTGAGAVASLTTVYAKNISASSIAGGNIGTATSNISGTGAALAKAWAQVDGFAPVSIRQGYNVSTFTRVSAGKYGISFTNPLSNGNYAIQCTSCDQAASAEQCKADVVTASPTTTGFRIIQENPSSGAVQDSGCLNLLIFGN